MTSEFATPTEALIPSLLHRAQAGVGRFMVTLRALPAPVFLRPPQSPQLKPFTFFMTRVSQPDGTKQLYLNMGYFDTLTDAERWAERARRRYPGAFATIAPGIPSRRAGAEAADAPTAAIHDDPAPAHDESLTDTQVMKILESRRDFTREVEIDERDVDQISLLRPEDTGTRLALKEAVVQGAPVCFAVQLHWSAEPIDLGRVRSLDIFSSYTLYATETRRKGHCHYFLRLGFFADPLSAKQVAVQVRSAYESAAVVPVIEPEVLRARDARAGAPAIPYIVAPQADEQDDSDDSATSRRTLEGTARRKRASKPAGQDAWTGSDPLSESGVRHLRVEALDEQTGRWKRIRLAGVTPNYS